MIRILIAEDMQILLDALVLVLNLEPDMAVVAQVTAGDAVVSAAVAHRPDLALIDVNLPGMDGLTAAEQLRERLPDCKVLILTVLGKPAHLRRALAAGVSGFLIKDAPSDELISAVRRVAAGEQAVDSHLALAALREAENPLSPRETEILRMCAAGADSADIAAELFLSQGTVRNYLTSAVTKLGARNRVDAVRIAAEAGWL